MGEIRKEMQRMSTSVMAEASERDDIFRSFQARKFDRKRVVPAVSMTVDADIGKLESIRGAGNEGLSKGESVSLTHVLIKATAIALKDFPLLFGAFDGRKVVRADTLKINLPVAEGCHVEYVVIESPERKTLGRIASEVKEEIARIRGGTGTFYGRLRKSMKVPLFARKLIDSIPGARIKSLNRHYGNFPLTNFGSFGVKNGVPVISSPVIAALCTGMTQEHAILPLTLVFDHRCVDGAYGGGFLRALKRSLERDPESLFA
jgi:pyruvate/2-oxoglutarate dehydrogenase complex dihydrolipoamide acyltransferase (E2) component